MKQFWSKKYWEKNYWKLLLVALLAGNLFVNGSLLDRLTAVTSQLSNKVTNTQPEETLLSVAKDKGKYIGIATQTYYVKDSKYSDVLSKEFNIITPEYQMKMNQIQPVRGKYTFTDGDALVKYAKDRGIAVRGHALIWHQSLPDWVQNGKFTRDEWIQIMKDHITQTVSHYKGKIYAWDVVNEAFWANGQYRPTVWYDNIGPEYIELAFKFAHDADPNALLFYNDFDTEVANDRSNAVYNMVASLVKKGVPINGVGFQTHLSMDKLPDFKAMKDNLARFGKLGVQTDITEMDIITHTVKGSQNERLKAEADAYSKVMEVAMATPSLKAVVFWGLKDDQSWLTKYTGFTEYPLLFDSGYSKKPAYNAVLDKMKSS